MERKARMGQGSSLLVTPGALVLFGVGLFFAVRLNSPVMAGLFLFFLLLGLAAQWWAARAIRGVSIHMECPRPRLFPGQQTTITYQIENDKALPLLWLELSQNAPERDCLVPEEEFEPYLLPGEEDSVPRPFLRQSFSFVGSYQTLVLESTWTAQRRGIYPIDQLTARSGDGFGLVQREQPLPGARYSVLAVYPRPVEVELSLFLQPQWDCAAGRRGYLEDNTVLRGSREYQPGDNWKHINWRMAAREQGLPLNLYQTIQPRGMTFLLDGESFAGREEELERALEILASVLTGVAAGGAECALVLPQSRRFAPLTLTCADGEAGELLFYLAGYDCLARLDPAVEQQPEPKIYLPSCFPGDAGTQAGALYLITRSGEKLPQALMRRLEPGRLWILCAQDWEVPTRAGFRSLALDSLRKGGGAP